ncbi:hypothetical protein [Thalassorhabdomicrobium marinisediminis]|uniref:Uncharacterized protein n=1 Tax=Thalassorhabdomicrobium marinisediminis TaxID=2170577 RepID=A0A2T7FXJ4_9RHOB|nr:hypothetical protein [Thalassorhabdomicrobium marinisediminis]PVA06884.1 hypothetical protein DC363_06950 [Thalassorhabdomicrobium marinisediminis]
MSADGEEVVATLEDDTGAYCVDIIKQADGRFTYVEYARNADDEDAWHPREDATAATYPSEFAAYTAAMRDVAWLGD